MILELQAMEQGDCTLYSNAPLIWIKSIHTLGLSNEIPNTSFTCLHSTGISLTARTNNDIQSRSMASRLRKLVDSFTTSRLSRCAVDFGITGTRSMYMTIPNSKGTTH